MTSGCIFAPPRFWGVGGAVLVVVVVVVVVGGLHWRLNWKFGRHWSRRQKPFSCWLSSLSLIVAHLEISRSECHFALIAVCLAFQLFWKSAQEEMVSRVLAMENFTEENYVGLKEYVMDLKVAALTYHPPGLSFQCWVAETAAAKAVEWQEEEERLSCRREAGAAAVVHSSQPHHCSYSTLLFCQKPPRHWTLQPNPRENTSTQASAFFKLVFFFLLLSILELKRSPRKVGSVMFWRGGQVEACNPGWGWSRRMNVYRTYISSSTIMICTTKRNKSKFRKVSASAAAIIAAAAGKYKPRQFSN